MGASGKTRFLIVWLSVLCLEADSAINILFYLRGIPKSINLVRFRINHERVVSGTVSYIF